jgi:predicted transcriptional regulator
MDKCLDSIKLHLPEDLKRDVQDLALAADRSVSEYIRHWLSLHVYGARAAERREGAERRGEGRS